MSSKVQINNISANGFTFKCRTCGLDNKGELIVFLHGWPESSMMWVNLMETFADKGYRCIAPDQRGYSKSARPIGMENYTQRILASDIIELVAAVGNPQKFQLVGHDWGGVIGWVLITLYPDRIQSWTSLSTPFSKVFVDAIKNDPDQRQRSQYIYNFLTPEIPEAYLGENDCERLRGQHIWAGFPDNLLEDYLTIFRDPTGRTATINWYRALMLAPEDENNPPIPYGDVYIPTLFIWGMNDVGIGKTGVNLGHPYMKGEYKYIQLNATHWLMEFNEEICSKEIIEHIEKYPIK